MPECEEKKGKVYSEGEVLCLQQEAYMEGYKYAIELLKEHIVSREQSSQRLY